MVDVIIFGPTVGSHRISNDVCRNKFSALAALLSTSWRELNILQTVSFHFQSNDMNISFENRLRWPTRLPSFKIFLFEWKWILIGLRGFIDRF